MPSRTYAMTLLTALSTALLTGAALASCGSADPPAAAPTTTVPSTAPATGITLPPTSGGLDYQLGGSYAPPAGVTVLARDSTEKPAAGVYSICYVNGFQTQPQETERWTREHPEVLLHRVDGQLFIDPGWPDEVMFDLRTAAARTTLVAYFEQVFDGCKKAGFQAVELDNLDTWTRSDGLLAEDDTVAYAKQLVTAIHARGLAAGQKNTAELDTRGRDEIRYDFAVVEECAVQQECADFTEVYGKHVLDIEYTDQLDALPCTDPALPELTVLRDRGLSTPDSADYARETC